MSSERPVIADRKGPIAWFAQNSVAANVLMLILLVGGATMASRLTQEVFPEVEFDAVVVNLVYPGASPEEVEQGVVLAAEEAVRGLDGVKKVTSTAAEGYGVLTVELLFGTNRDRALADIKSAIDRVTSFPESLERPDVFLATNRTRVVSVVVYGNVSEKSLRAYAERVREELLAGGRVTLAELSATRPPEISVEVSQDTLRRYGLTLDGIAARVRAASIELPGGAVKTPRGEILLRTAERRETGLELEDIAVRTRPDGSEVRLGEIASVRDGFQETDQSAFFDGKRAMLVEVYRVGEETPTELSRAVHEYIEAATLPEGVGLATWFDTSEMYEDRVDLLMRNAAIGLVLVLLTLGLFLEMRLAFWVTLGIPISFVGALLFLPATGLTINMISLFAFIVVLGMVVDDAIVVGEAIYRWRQEGKGRLDAAILGTREVAFPVLFAVITTMIAFAPMLFVPGFAGDFFRNIPLVVIAVLFISLIESLYILPAHLAHSKPPSERGVFGWVHHQQQRFSRFIEWLIEHTYVPTLRFAARRRYLTLSIGVAIFASIVGLVAGGRIGFTFMPRIESDLVVARLDLPFGSAVEDTEALQMRLRTALDASLAELGDPEGHVRGIFSQVGQASWSGGGGPGGRRSVAGGHIAEVAAFLVPIDARPFTAESLARSWRARVGELPGVESLKFRYDTGGSGDAPIHFDLSHRDTEVLRTASAELAGHLRQYAGVFDIEDGFASGKEQMDLTLKPDADHLGLTEIELARQVRAAFYGSEAVRQQRGRDELRVYVRYPLAERRSEHDVETLMVRTPAGGEVPLPLVAEVARGYADTEIIRRDGRRVAGVTADVDTAVANANAVVASATESVLPGLVETYPGLTWQPGGEQQNQAEIMSSLGNLFGLALICIFALLAVAFRSYYQPLIIMGAIPFGIVGAILGHILMGYDLSLMSMMGVVALSGVVVNDSLILIVAINEYRKQMPDAVEAVVAGGARRFRPILLTSLTTFFGLAPMILETSVQARFLIPMAISLGFGIMFATTITLILVPTLYLILEDFRRAGRRLVRYVKEGPQADPGLGEEAKA